ncbi:methyl-accepting chemotaxis protein [Hahella aquimaris]|uniref:methyl-accepting chemotaxis protein n=1 Tax=Hahella sp. HNIBRBA332 TaxID=3015983 RepID=UPI00273A852A|nr:methyl-accepting chemotaxis protein [Hahella sp. HNIBRBA332]WLQ16323.1 methyl-accepting chemotaxis protein [Hahella sp. HNIBRBA332]
MLSYLRQITIRHRFYLILFLFVIGLLAVVAMAYFNASKNLMDGKKESARNAVDAAISIIATYQKKATDGTLEDAKAREQALRTIESIRYAGAEYIWINDLNHTVLMHPIKPELNGKRLYDLKDPNGVYLFREFVSVVKQNKAGFVPYYWPKPGHKDPVAKVSYVKGFEPWGWVVGSGVYVDDVEAVLSQQMIEMLVTVSIIIVLLLLILMIVANSVTSPLNRTLERMGDIASGDGDLTVYLQTDGRDELAALSVQFNTFVDKIRNLVSNVTSSIDLLTLSVDELSNAAMKSVDNAQNQQKETDQVASAMNQMSASAQEIAQNANRAAQCAADADNDSDQGRLIMKNTLVTVDELAAEMNQTTLSIESLRAETVNIGSVLTVIESIAEQTNLLALNAAIEAARAGELGRGFAVVADEVRALASKTQHSTQEINEMIGKLQTGASSAVSAMEKSLHKARGAQEQTQSVEHALDKVITSITEINDVNNQIATASEQQSLVSEEINKNVSNIAVIAEENSESINQVRSSCESIRQVSEILIQQAKQFKVS